MTIQKMCCYIVGLNYYFVKKDNWQNGKFNSDIKFDYKFRCFWGECTLTLNFQKKEISVFHHFQWIWPQVLKVKDKNCKIALLQTIGFFNEADTLVSSSILIYSQLQMGSYTQLGQREAALIEMVIKRES